MRKYVAAIAFLFLFSSLQFGNMVSYMYCKWKAVVLEHKSDCGCDQELAAQYGQWLPQDQLSSISLPVLTTDYVFMICRDEPVCPVLSLDNSFAGYQYGSSQFEAASLLRPPASLA